MLGSNLRRWYTITSQAHSKRFESFCSLLKDYSLSSVNRAALHLILSTTITCQDPSQIHFLAYDLHLQFTKCFVPLHWEKQSQTNNCKSQRKNGRSHQIPTIHCPHNVSPSFDVSAIAVPLHPVRSIIAAMNARKRSAEEAFDHERSSVLPRQEVSVI